MSNGTEICKVLEELFSNPNFITDLMQDSNGNPIASYKVAIRKMEYVIRYYIATRDTNTHHTFKEIMELYDAARKTNLPLVAYNTTRNGFLVHVCNGNKMAQILKYGLNYGEIQEIQEEIAHRRELLARVEGFSQESRWKTQEDEKKRGKSIKKDTIYMSPSLYEVLGYAIREVPERVFEGPLFDTSMRSCFNSG